MLVVLPSRTTTITITNQDTSKYVRVKFFTVFLGNEPTDIIYYSFCTTQRQATACVPQVSCILISNIFAVLVDEVKKVHNNN